MTYLFVTYIIKYIYIIFIVHCIIYCYIDNNCFHILIAMRARNTDETRLWRNPKRFRRFTKEFINKNLIQNLDSKSLFNIEKS